MAIVEISFGVASLAYGLVLIFFPTKVRAVHAYFAEVTNGYRLDPDHIWHWPGTYRVAGIIIVAIVLIVAVGTLAGG